MTESKLMDMLFEEFRSLKEDNSNKYSPNLFKDVIKNNVPVWTSINNTPSIAFYMANSKYIENNYSENTISEIVIYIYNRHRTKGLSLEDILSPLVDRVRGAVKLLPSQDNNILTASIVESNKDGGTILPYTIAELVLRVESVDSKSTVMGVSCN